MEKIKNIFKERANGVFLIFFAVLIVSGLALNSHSADSTEAKSSLVITSGEESKSYKTATPSGINVIDLMDLLQKDSSQNFSYNSSSGFVDKINSAENSGNMSWMLYACKDNTCKLSSVGAVDCKVGDWDKIEWKYLDWTTMDWSTW